MRWLIWIFVLGALATGLVLLAGLNAGYVLVALPGYRAELSLNFALILLLAGFAAAHLLLRLLAATLELPGRVARFRAERRARAARDMLFDGLRDFFAGRYARAEKSANRAVAQGAPADIGALIAARAAHELRAPERRDRYLADLSAQAGKTAAARVASTAQMLLAEQRPADALAALAALPEKHTAALRLELRARQQLGHWEQVPALIEQLQKRGVFGSDRAEAELRHAWCRLIEGAAGDADALIAAWRRVPERDRRDTAVAAAAATAFQALGRDAEAQDIIERSLEAEWDGALAGLYGECAAAGALPRIERAERWLRDRREDADLLLALGRLCARQQLWGKAQSYLEAAISLEASHSAHLELAQLHEQLGRGDAARTHYRASLDLALQQLKRASGGRRRSTR